MFQHQHFLSALGQLIISRSPHGADSDHVESHLIGMTYAWLTKPPSPAVLENVVLIVNICAGRGSAAGGRAEIRFSTGVVTRVDCTEPGFV